MATELPSATRRAVNDHAQGQCEYCRKPDDREFNPYRHEVDHVLAEKHVGRTELSNLAYACFWCNRHKGTDIASLDPQTGEVRQLFNPRKQQLDRSF